MRQLVETMFGKRMLWWKTWMQEGSGHLQHLQTFHYGTRSHIMHCRERNDFIRIQLSGSMSGLFHKAYPSIPSRNPSVITNKQQSQCLIVSKLLCLLIYDTVPRLDSYHCLGGSLPKQYVSKLDLADQFQEFENIFGLE